jgi:hypothetical protein
MEGKVMNFKLAWVDDKNSSVLHSKMFETKEEAIKESQDKKDFMLFSLEKMEDGSYTWNLLPYGTYYSFKVGIGIKNFWLKYQGYIFTALGAYVAYKIVFAPTNNKKQ